MLLGQVRAVPGYFNRMSSFNLDVLKCVALVAMLIDHMNDILLSPSSPLLYAVGRMAMPLFALIFAFNLSKHPVRAQELANRQWIWAIITQPFFIFAFYGHQPWYALNILFVFAVCSQLVAWIHSGAPYCGLKSFLLISVFIWPLSLASYGIVGIAFVLISALLFSSAIPNRGVSILWLLLLIGLNATALFQTPTLTVLIFSILPTLFLPLLILHLTDVNKTIGARFLPSQTFYWLYCLHLLLLGGVSLYLRI